MKLQQAAALRIFLLLVGSVTLVFAQKSYRSATLAGKVQGLDTVGCQGGFIDSKGACWKCPPGYQHDNVLLAPTDGKVCKNAGGRTQREGRKQAKATGALQTDCPPGQWWSSHNGFCYSCAKGFTHDAAKTGNQDGACWKDEPDRYAAATRMKGNAFCDTKNAFPDLDGNCYTCPASFQRNPAPSSVRGAEACVNSSCGARNERPCLVTERLMSCDKGLAEDFIAGKCVPDMSRQTCIAIIKGIASGKLPDGLSDALAPIVTRIRNDSPGKRDKPLYNRYLAQATQSVQPLLAPLKEFQKQANAQAKAIRESFDAEVICSPEKMRAKLRTMAKPRFEGTFFTSQALSFSASAVAGVQLAIMYVTDWRNQIGVYVALGGQLAPLTVGAGGNIGIQFYPATTLADFEGYGYGIGASVGTPIADVGVGIDFAYPFPLDSTKLVPMGYGINTGIGANAVPTPVDGSIGLSYSWKIWTTAP